MTLARARLLVVLGVVGLLTIGTITAFSFVHGRHGSEAGRTISSCGPDGARGTVVHVTLSDRGGGMMASDNLMMVGLSASPESVHSGSVTFIATNVGALNHEFLILPAPRDGDGTRAVDTGGKIDELSSLAEASTSCGRGSGQGIAPGTSSWVTVHLAPGRYELLCDMAWHYANGMFASFNVR